MIYIYLSPWQTCVLAGRCLIYKLPIQFRILDCRLISIKQNYLIICLPLLVLNKTAFYLQPLSFVAGINRIKPSLWFTVSLDLFPPFQSQRVEKSFKSQLCTLHVAFQQWCTLRGQWLSFYILWSQPSILTEGQELYSLLEHIQHRFSLAVKGSDSEQIRRVLGYV